MKMNPIELWNSWSKKSGLTTYCIMNNDEHVGTVVFRRVLTTGSVHVVAFDMSDDKRVGYSNRVGGAGYDKATHALRDWSLCGYTIKDDSLTWDAQLRQQGFTVIQTL